MWKKSPINKTQVLIKNNKKNKLKEMNHEFVSDNIVVYFMRVLWCWF